jgi:glycosyltransferase involved in cell wall biosynthesis
VHIAVAHYGARNDVSGVTTWLGGLISRIRAKDHTVDLLIHHLGENPLESSFLNQYGALARLLTAKTKPEWTEDAVRQTIDFLNQGRPQVFLPQCLPGFHFAARFCERYELPWVFTVHSDDPVYWGLLEECAPDRSRGTVVVVSDYLNQEVRRRGLATNPITIPYGVNVPDVRARFRRDPFRVVFAGRVVELQKRISLVLQAMALACRDDSSIECLVMGHGPDLAKSQDWVKAQGLSKRIQFTGSLKNEDVIHRLFESQAFLLMSDFEGLPVSLLEAMACGLVPIVRSIPSGVCQLVKPNETGFLTSDDPADAAKTILILAQNPELWNRLSVNARALASKDYDAGTCHEKWLTLLEGLARNSAPKFPVPNPRTLRLASVNPKLLGVDVRRPRGRQWISFVNRRVQRRFRRLLPQ